MPLTVTLEISDAELAHFRSILERARARNAGRAPHAVAAAARSAVARMQARGPSPWVATRLAKVNALAEMLEDPEWDLPAQMRRRVLDGLAYVADSHDLVPDTVPVLGLLDDAIMLELVLRDLRHEFAGYEEFQAFRHEAEAGPAGASHAAASREDWLASKRRALHDRIQQRRERDLQDYGGEFSLITHL